jgi:hypothetical protein
MNLVQIVLLGATVYAGERGYQSIPFRGENVDKRRNAE